MINDWREQELEEDEEGQDEELEEEAEEETEEQEETEEIRPEAESLELLAQSRNSADAVPENAVEESEFSDEFLSPGGEFAAPILTPDEPSLEETAQDAPVMAPVPATNTQEVYLPSSEYKGIERESGGGGSYEGREEDGYGRGRREEPRFDAGEGLIADTSKIVRQDFPIPSFARGADRGSDVRRDELEEFAKEQRRYEEAREEERAPPFMRRRKTKNL